MKVLFLLLLFLLFHSHPYVSSSLKTHEANGKFDQGMLQEMELAPVQRKIEARSAEDSFTGFVRTLYFADTFLRDSE